jgi:hypothetical protein
VLTRNQVLEAVFPGRKEESKPKGFSLFQRRKKTTKSGDHVKTDRKDAIKLARLHRAGELVSVFVPDETDDQTLVDEAIAYYQTANQMFRSGEMREHDAAAP